MNPPDQDRFWREVFSEETIEAIRESSLQAGVAAAKIRRQRRMAVSTSLGSLAVLLLLVATWRRPQSVIHPAPGVVLAPVASPAVKFISDQQLLALFPNRPVALIGPAGARRLVFLDAVR